MITRCRVVDAEAPPERLAALRMSVGSFALGYLLIRLPVFLELRNRLPESFDGAGVFALVGRPMSSWLIVAIVVAAVIAGLCFTTGFRFRVSGPLFAVLLLVLTSYRSSWGQLLHFENLVVLHALIVGLAPSADVWSLDARRLGPRRRDPTSYGWPIQLACVVVVSTYFIAGVAKLRYGGIEWMLGDTLRNHIAYSAVRLELLGASASPLASGAVSHGWMLPPMAVGSVLFELVAPIALLGSWYRNVWVAGVWLMHMTIFGLMLVGFPYPIFLVAFAPFFELERLVAALRGRRRSASRS